MGSMHRRISVLLAAALALSLAGPAPAAEDEGAKERTAGHKVLFWIPNRVLDLLDVVRLRGRVGPGVAVSVRATENVDAYLGAYATVYVGLPGPRNRRIPKLPLGIESRIGAEVSRADLSTGFWIFDPDYSTTEFGLGAQVLLLGADIGFDPMEFVDLLGGIVLQDPREDDL